MRVSVSDSIDLEQQVRMFTDVIKDVRARRSEPGLCRRIADYEEIVSELRDALAAMTPSRLH
ncbi:MULTISPECIES: hypothetical protein [Neorhizobium]|uniref:hypothetical protein n=1 Tax=Neorhizobium sp. T6_25 TaxID=2093833 RepID=UPI00155EE549|nr:MULTISPECIES: hypothetical protein [Neorhizobium]